MQRSFSFTQKLIHFVAFGFGSGKAPLAPGTFGTLAAVPIYFLLHETGVVIYTGVVIVMFVFGVWCCGVTERDYQKTDMSSIVWDEIVGYLMTMFMAPMDWWWAAVGFVLFRLFDIWKPFPIRMLERRVPGGFGVMLDDALAGVYACVLLQVIVFSSRSV